MIQIYLQENVALLVQSATDAAHRKIPYLKVSIQYIGFFHPFRGFQGVLATILKGWLL